MVESILIDRNYFLSQSARAQHPKTVDGCALYSKYTFCHFHKAWQQKVDAKRTTSNKQQTKQASFDSNNNNNVTRIEDNGDKNNAITKTNCRLCVVGFPCVFSYVILSIFHSHHTNNAAFVTETNCARTSRNRKTIGFD